MVSSKPVSFKTIVTLSLSALLLSLPATVSGRDIPANLKSFYNTVKTKGCSKPFKSGFEDGHDHSGFAYCADYKDHGLIYLTGPKSLGDMDIDCDGADNKAGKCSNDKSGQSQTAFKDTVETYGISDLNANIHPYVVFGNEDGKPSFKPQSVGMKPLSVMAVVCNNNLFYGIWGDTNGGKDTGEAAISLATACFPDDDITGDSGHTEHDVLYLGFLNTSSVPGKHGAKWDAKSFEEFEQSIAHLGDTLVATVPSK